MQRVYLCDKRAIDHDQVLISPSRSMFALLPAPSLLHFGEMRFMRFEALFEALFDVMQPPEGSIPPHSLDKSESRSAALDGGLRS